MAHFAKLDSNNVVVSIHIVHNSVIGDVEDGQHDNEQIGIDFLISSNGIGWYKQTSYNNNFRKKFAAVGDTYDPTNDVFIRPQPSNSFSLNPETLEWEPPVAYPSDGERYSWVEQSQSWVIDDG